MMTDDRPKVVDREYHDTVVRMLTEERDTANARLQKAENRLALLENTWAEASRIAEIKGTMEEGMVAMAREIYRHMYPYA